MQSSVFQELCSSDSRYLLFQCFPASAVRLGSWGRLLFSRRGGGTPETPTCSPNPTMAIAWLLEEQLSRGLGSADVLPGWAVTQWKPAAGFSGFSL